MKLSTRILALLLAAAACPTFLFQAALAAEEPADGPLPPDAVIVEPEEADGFDQAVTEEAEEAVGVTEDPAQSAEPAEEEPEAVLTGWVREDGVWHYYDESGALLTNDWAPDGDTWYWMGADGAVSEPPAEEEPAAEPAEAFDPAFDGAADDGVTPVKDRGAALKGKWTEVDGVWYYYVDGSPVKKTLAYIDGGTYYFTGSGAVKTGWLRTSYQTSDGAAHSSWSWFDSDGVRKEGGWLQDGSDWVYLVNGFALSDCEYKISGYTYRFTADCGIKTGWARTSYTGDDGKERSAWCYYGSDGARTESGWLKTGGQWVYFVNGHTIADCERKISGSWYKFDADSAMITGWAKNTRKNASGQKVPAWSYYQSSGAAYMDGWLQLGSVWYYFVDGYAVTGEERTINGRDYLFDEDGHVVKGWFKDTYTDANGKTRTGWGYADTYVGRYVSGPYKISGYWYYFNDDGIAQKDGWIRADGSWYYANSDGTLDTASWWKHDGCWYYFDYNGRMATGWKTIGGYAYYFYTGEEEDGGPAYTLATNYTVGSYTTDANGYSDDLSVKERMRLEAQNYTSPTDWLIIIDRYYCKLGIFARNSKGQWVYTDYIDCAPGKASTPTYWGVYSITTSRGYYFNSGAVRCYWYSTFNGGQAIHSVLYYPEGGLADGRVGMRLSHGCVRVSYSYAKWIYDNIPVGTTVVVI